MKTKEISTKNQAMIWWDALPVFGIPSKEYYIGLYYSDDNVTPERIEEIYDKEHKSICNYCNSTINSCSDIEAETCENLEQLNSETTTREQALDWWNSLKSDGLKAGYTEKHIQQGFRYKSLTGREIEKIWLKETGGELATGGEKVLEILDSKPNAKEFKQFDESLFKAYIDKFSDEDKLKMLQVLYFSQSKPASMKLTNAILDYTK